MLQNEQMVVIGVLGQKQVGKTFLVNKYLTNQLPEKYSSTTAVQFSTGVYQCNEGTRVKLKIWDTSSQQKYKSIVCYHLKECQGIFLMFDLTDENSFKQMAHWEQRLQKQKILHDKKTHLILLGNKIDLVRKDKANRRVSKIQAQKYCKKIGCNSYFQISVTEGTNIDECIQQMVDTILTERAGKQIQQKMKAQQKLIQESVCSNCFIY